MSEKTELAVKFVATRNDVKFLPIMADHALQEMKRHIHDSGLVAISEPREELTRYLSSTTSRWHQYDPTRGYFYGEGDALAWEYVVTQWAADRG